MATIPVHRPAGGWTDRLRAYSDTLALDLGDDDVIHLGVGNDVEWKQPGGPYGTLIEVAVKLAIKRDGYLKLAPIEPPAA